MYTGRIDGWKRMLKLVEVIDNEVNWECKTWQRDLDDEKIKLVVMFAWSGSMYFVLGNHYH